ncbi:MAG: membrane protein of unknown function [Promethearchaeota archaeon]|nr:MAG: membrane protein of unknown function [Candidatus Lokiarchaeota archaeon]
MKKEELFTKWFSFRLDETKRRIFLLISVIGIIGSLANIFSSIHAIIMNIINMDPSTRSLHFMLKIMSLNSIYLLSHIGTFLLCLYTINRTKRKKITRCHNELEEKPRWISFSLGHDQALTLFILSIIFIYIEIRYLHYSIIWESNFLEIPRAGGYIGYIIFTDQIHYVALTIIFAFFLYTIIKSQKLVYFNDEDTKGALENTEKRKDYKVFNKKITQNKAILIVFFSIVFLIITLPVLVHFTLIYSLIFSIAFIDPLALFLGPIDYFNALTFRYLMTFLLLFLLSYYGIKDLLRSSHLKKHKK